MVTKMIRKMTAKVLVRSLPAIALAAGMLFLIGVPDASARSTCVARIDRKEASLSNDIYHHGQYSWQANRDRAQLARIHQLCAPPPAPAQYYSALAPRAYAQPYPAPPYRPAYPPAPPPPPYYRPY